MILAFYWGIASALVLFFAKSPALRRRLGAGDLWQEPTTPILVGSVLVLCAAILGIRVVASLPLEVRANWIFQVTPVPAGPRTLAAVRRAFYVLGLAPVLLGSGALFLSLWPWPAAVGHLAVLWLLGIALTEVSLSSFPKIPYTCSYLPGKSQTNMVVLGFLGVVFLIMKGAEFERTALGDSRMFAAMIATFGIAALVARWRTSRIAKPPHSELRFEEEPAPAIYALNLHRDGTPPV
jgi:hypothetical protein